MQRSLLLVLLLASLARAGAAQSLYADPKAREAGDLITVVLAERTAAEQHSLYDKASRSQASAASSADGDGLSGKFAADAELGFDTRSRKQASQSDLLQGYITAVVVARDSLGILHIQGERKISVNGATHLMKVSGLVRPRDIRYNNTVYSYQIANAQVEYRRAGMKGKFFKPGTLTRVGAIALLGAAVFAGGSAAAN